MGLKLAKYNLGVGRASSMLGIGVGLFVWEWRGPESQVDFKQRVGVGLLVNLGMRGGAGCKQRVGVGLLVNLGVDTLIPSP